MRRYPDQEQEHDPPQRRQGVSEPVRTSYRRGEQSRDLARGSWGRHDGLLLRDLQFHVGRRGGGLHQRFRVGERSAERPDEFHVPILSEYIRHETARQASRAAGAEPDHRQREPIVDQPRRMREHASGRVQRVPTRVREGRVRS